MNVEHLVTMANDIARFFASEPDQETAVHAVADHLTRFWEPRMRKQIAAHLNEGGEGLSAIAAAAVARVGELAMNPKIQNPKPKSQENPKHDS